MPTTPTRPAPIALAQLSPSALGTLVSGRDATPAALHELVRRQPATLPRTLERLLAEDDHPLNVRTAAAVQMRLQPRLASETALVQALSSKAAPLRRRAAEALGHSGSPRALEALKAQRLPADTATARAIRFARHLLAYRHGIEGHRLQPPAAAMAIQPRLARSMPIEALTAAKAKPILDTLPAGTLPFPVNASGQHRIDCGEETLLLVFHRDIQTGASRRSLLSRPAVVAALLVWHAAPQVWRLGEYLLAHPVRDGGIQLVGARSTGNSVHLGEAQIAGDDVSFSLRTLPDTHMPAIQLTGSVRGSRAPQVQIAGVAEQELRGAGKQLPRPVPAGD
jgi:hypothetical protein